MHLISINLHTSSHDWQLPQQKILLGVDGGVIDINGPSACQAIA